jgi:hypothetical protein
MLRSAHSDVHKGGPTCWFRNDCHCTTDPQNFTSGFCFNIPGAPGYLARTIERCMWSLLRRLVPLRAKPKLALSKPLLFFYPAGPRRGCYIKQILPGPRDWGRHWHSLYSLAVKRYSARVHFSKHRVFSLKNIVLKITAATAPHLLKKIDGST